MYFKLDSYCYLEMCTYLHSLVYNWQLCLRICPNALWNFRSYLRIMLFTFPIIFVLCYNMNTLYFMNVLLEYFQYNFLIQYAKYITKYPSYLTQYVCIMLAKYATYYTYSVELVVILKVNTRSL